MATSMLDHQSLNYLKWNDAIAQYFFNSHKDGQRVWFSVEKELIKEIAKKNSSTFEDFIQAVKKGPDQVQNNSKCNNVCKKARKIFEEWQAHPDKFAYPPYIAYLALFVLAVNHEEDGDFSENAYYPRLKHILDNEEDISTQDFISNNISDLWDDLEKWSVKNKNGKLGEFHLDIYGNYFYVGILYYQVVLTQDDLKKLPEIFWKMGWDSDSNPTDEEILKALEIHKKSFSNRTSTRIERRKKDFCIALIQRVLKQLEEYDDDHSTTEADTEKRGFIDLCLINNTAQQVKFSFRCRRKAGLPQEDFVLKKDNKNWQVVVSNFSVSAPVQGFEIDDWTQNFDAETESDKCKFHYRGEKYKIFTRADDRFGISGWISGQRYTPDKLFYLAIHKELLDKVQKWGKEQCNECCKLDFGGVPQDWHVFKIKGVKDDSLIKKDIRALSIDENPRIQFKGGIRLSKKNQFFDFAPPKILILGGKENYIPFYAINNGERKEKLIPNQEGLFSLPENIPEEITVIISNKELSCEKSDVKKQIRLTLVKSRLKKFNEYSSQFQLDCFGNFQSDQSKKYLQGAYGPQISNNYLRWLDSSFKASSKKTYLIGEVPGQIAVWPHCSQQWQPIWMIQFQTYKKATAYILNNPNKKDTPDQLRFSKEKIKQWKEVIWHRRKRIQVESKSKAKWKKFLERVENV